MRETPGEHEIAAAQTSAIDQGVVTRVTLPARLLWTNDRLAGIVRTESVWSAFVARRMCESAATELSAQNSPMLSFEFCREFDYFRSSQRRKITSGHRLDSHG